jgi:hypothetical protein
MDDVSLIHVIIKEGIRQNGQLAFDQYMMSLRNNIKLARDVITRVCIIFSILFCTLCIHATQQVIS